MLVALVAGVFSYLHLGREEDPAFTIRTMVIAAQWPGAKAEDVAVQVTERIERELQDLESLDYTRSVTTAGKTTVFVSLRNETPAATVRSVWLQVRAMIGDIARSFPQGVQGPFFNDRFGDVFGNIYAFTGDGITQRQLRDYVEDARSKVLTLKEAGSVELIGAQDEVVNLEFSTRRLAALGISAQQVIATLQDQNAVATSGVIEAGPERVAVRVRRHRAAARRPDREDDQHGDLVYSAIRTACRPRGDHPRRRRARPHDGRVPEEGRAPRARTRYGARGERGDASGHLLRVPGRAANLPPPRDHVARPGDVPARRRRRQARGRVLGRRVFRRRGCGVHPLLVRRTRRPLGAGGRVLRGGDHPS
ncbi:MAG: efflux RND transporter permease subunit [Variovorax sp.]|nr:efflux RND transporter permease subunit [Variovorax sp.]